MQACKPFGLLVEGLGCQTAAILLSHTTVCVVSAAVAAASVLQLLVPALRLRTPTRATPHRLRPTGATLRLW